MPLYYNVIPRSQGGTGVSTTPAAPAAFTPADPTATASTTLVMMGLSSTCLYTPTSSGKVLAVVTGGLSTNTAAVTGQFGGRYGTTGGSPATTVAAGSNGGTISGIAAWGTPGAGQLAVASTAAFPSSGTIYVAASGTTCAQVTYSGTSGGNTFTGCAYVAGSAAGTVATGGAVTGVPQNQAPVAGTRFGSAGDIQFKSSGVPATVQTFGLTAMLALTANTAYWFDIALLTSTAGDTATLKNASVVLVELS